MFSPKVVRQVEYRPTPKARYDAAQTGSQNRNHWANADDLGPNAANSATIRATLRRRARYERDNDPHLCGLVKTLAHDLIGTGPRLQLTPADDSQRDLAREVEAIFHKWALSIDLADKLRVMAESRPIDGEAFAILTTNTRLNGVKLDVRLIEPEMIDTPLGLLNSPNIYDGIEYDGQDNPIRYYVLNQHPGESPYYMDRDNGAKPVPAERVIHWFRPSRPGQYRGSSEFASSLEIGAQTRRYAAATLGKAEICANIAGVMETESIVDSGDSPTFETMEEVEFPRMGLMTLPGGYKAKTFEPGQNTTGYAEYVGEKRCEMGRPVLAPKNVMTGNSSGYNYSSGRLDHIPYHRVQWIERERFRVRVLDKIWNEFLIVGESQLPVPAETIREWEVDYQWDAFDDLDPVKSAQAWKQLIDLKIATRTEACAARGYRFREVIDTLAAEEEYMRSKGLDPSTESAPMPAAAPVADDPEDDEDTTLERDPRRGARSYV